MVPIEGVYVVCRDISSVPHAYKPAPDKLTGTKSDGVAYPHPNQFDGNGRAHHQK